MTREPDTTIRQQQDGSEFAIAALAKSSDDSPGCQRSEDRITDYAGIPARLRLAETRGSLSAYSLPVMQVQGGRRGRAERELFIAYMARNSGFQLQSDSC